MAMSTGGSGPAMAEINVTPLVDVMLVLLIIFMITAPLLQQGVKVALPQTKAQALDVDSKRLIVSLTKDKRIFIGESEVQRIALRETLVGNLKLQQDKEVYLHADRLLPYGFVVDVMAVLKDAGVDNLGMVTDPVHTKKE